MIQNTNDIINTFIKEIINQSNGCYISVYDSNNKLIYTFIEEPILDDNDINYISLYEKHGRCKLHDSLTFTYTFIPYDY